MANRFLNNITINDEYTLPSADGTADQIITTDGSGQLSFVDQNTINAGNAEHVVIYAKNTSGASISKGTPVYITGTVGATDTVEIAPADAGNSAKMPAVGLLDATLAVNAFGYVITGGFMDNITTDPIDGATPTSNDTVYVKVGGGLTLTKPTGPTGLIQNVAKVGKVSGGNSGSLIVSSILRTNDVPNLTTGKIWVGSAANTIESATVHLDETNGRMGVGTTNPQKLLEVRSSTAYNSTLRLQTSAHNWDIQGGETGYSSTAFALDYDGTTFFRAMGITDSRFSGGLSVGTINATPPTGGLYVAGNVGIGTTSPSEKLEVAGNALINNSGEGKLYLGSTSHYIGNISDDIYLVTSGQNIFYAGGFEKMRIKTSGYVGIGTTGPQSILHIASANPEFILEDTSNPNKCKIKNNDGNLRYEADYNNEFGNSRHVFFVDGSEKLRINTNGNVGIGTTSPGEKLHVEGDIRLLDELIFGEYSTTTDRITNQSYALTIAHSDSINFKVGTASVFNVYGTQIRPQVNDTVDLGHSGFRWKRGFFDDNILTNGNIGIGTDYPSDELTIEAETPTIRLKDISSSNYAEFYVNNFDTYLDCAGRTFIRNGGSTNVTVTSTGNVGIGTTTPSTPLHINADAPTIRLQDATSGDNHYLTGNNGELRVQSSGYITMRPGAAVSTTFLANGNVGIGTTSPTAKLHVSSDSGGALSEVAHFVGGGSTNDKSQISVGGNTSSALVSFGFRNTGSGFGYIANASDTEIITIDGGNERVGIGTTSPSEKLHVVGYVKSSIGLKVGNYTILNESGDETSLSNTAYYPMFFKTNNSTRMTISNAGNVGIGTTSPSQKLEVSGNVKLDGDNRHIYFGGNNTFIGERSNSTELELRGGGNSTAQTVYIDNTGQIGVGTSNPSYKLDVNGSAQFNTNTGTTPFYITRLGGPNQALKIHVDDRNAVFESIQDETTDDYGGFVFNMDAGATEPYFDVRKNDSTIMRVDGTGNVGIGTTSPSAKLHILDNAEQSKVRIGSDASNYLQVDVAGDGDSTISAVGSGFLPPDIKFNTNSSTILTINGAFGNVGIGTATPSEKLEVDGNVQAETLIATDLTDGYVPWSRNGTVGLQDSEIYQDNGQVGIGTTTLSQALNVNGDVLADGYRLSAMQTAPATRNSTGTLGEIRITSNYIYVCYATNSWSRVALATSW